ncbi:MAG: hypothetical protein LUC83_02605 [Clostridiales bacterium]|nr:hypothetical protein [Clostridiales bacterium]
MATIYIGSARHDENGKYTGGAAGDQTQKSSTNDTVGEVSMQSFYVHSKGWYIIRPKSVSVANAIAAAMKTLCNNSNVGYDQGNRNGVITYGVDTKTKTECDCSSGVRACVIKGAGKDPGNFTTANEATVLAKTGLFNDKVAYVSQAKTPVYNGDILVTKTKGHTVIVVSGNARSAKNDLTVDGQWGEKTCERAQEVFGTTQDGYLSGQKSSLKQYHLGVFCAKYATNGSGSQLIKAIQKTLSLTQSGQLDQTTIKGMQKWMKTTQDGKISNPSQMVKAFQTWLNEQ